MSMQRPKTATILNAKAGHATHEVCAASACVHSLRHSLTLVRRSLSEWHHSGYT